MSAAEAQALGLKAWKVKPEPAESVRAYTRRNLCQQMRRPGFKAVTAKLMQRRRQSSAAANFVRARWRRFARKQPRDVFYNVSRTFITVIITLLLVCTAIDILPQSFSSGQFWNSIIVIAAMSLIAVWAIVLHLIRRVTVNRWLAALPRSHQIARRDVGKKLKTRIVEARQRCQDLFLSQRDFTQVRHPGLQNPQVKEAVHGDILDVGVPFWKMADMLPLFMEDYCTLLVPDYIRPPGASLREYLEAALQGQLIMPGTQPYIARFLDLYEQLRYSGRNVSQETLFELMSAFTNILNRFQLPDGSDARNGAPSRPAARGEVAYAHDGSEDGGPLTLVPSEVVESSQSSYSSSGESVQIHPTRTQDSWVSHTSHASSSVSHGLGMRLRDRLRRRGSSILSLLAFESDEQVPGLPHRPLFVEDHEHHLLPPRESDFGRSGGAGNASSISGGRTVSSGSAPSSR